MTRKNRKKQTMNKKDHKAEEKKNKALPGFPGYRTREGRSGYDYVDSELEAGHMFGVFLRRFFTLSIRIRSFGVLFLMTLAGVFLLFPLIFVAQEALNSGMVGWELWVIGGVCAAIGLLAIGNVVRSFFRKG